VALDVPLPKLFEYSLPAEMEARAGDRVAVRFGAQQKIGVVIEDSITPQLAVARIKPVTARRDDAPQLPPDWIALMRFLSGYYQRPLGETVISSLPPRLRSTKPLPKKVLQSADRSSGTRFVQSHALTALQAGVVERIRPGFHAYLLHGVTGSGKTEVYLRVIAETLAAGKTALVLVPEISLTPQLAARFRARFGDLVAILHSGLTEQARLGEWSRLHRGEARIAVGARSAVFAPMTNIGVIVVDEEHDGSFKQDEGVRYHGRDVALVRAQRAGAVCVLGSATPSLETFAHAQRGNYVHLRLTVRPTARPMPSVEIVDLRTHLPDGDAFLSSPLRNAIGETIASGDQVILFLNRRGFSTFVLCRGCGHAFRCPHCSVSLTYHRHTDRLSCHYCGFHQRIPDVCPGCGVVIPQEGLDRVL
jgi:primosomal protein N' (replication factor Y)